MSDLDSAREAWDAEAAAFDDEPDHGLRDPEVRGAWRALLESVLPPAPSRIADLGCGTGTLTTLLAEMGHVVHGVDLSPAMLSRARPKAAGLDVTFAEGDAADPPLPAEHYDVVLSRHVLWALPDPAAALERWCGLLRPEGRLVLVEGFWSTGAGLTAAEAEALVRGRGRASVVRPMTDPAYWGREITDERYLLLSS
jgi:SAM-dependent methyltransferase